MKRKQSLIAFTAILLFNLFLNNFVKAQCQFYAEKVAHKLAPYKSDGQFHGALLAEGETVEFVATFHAGNAYRIRASTGPNSDTLVFRVLDSKYNLVYSNSDYNFSQYWDFKFNATDKYYIQAELYEGAGSGCAVLLVGFKQ